MKKIKDIFFNYELTWKRLIIFSIICGVITGIIPLIKIFNDTSIHNISECFEMWILLAMFAILNSKKPLEAGLKTFVFFLISQPLCYLVQVPFYTGGFEIFQFYKTWFYFTLLTFPGGIVAFYTKKENYLSVFILSLAFLLLGYEFNIHLNTLLTSFPHQLLAILFILTECILFINIIFNDKKKRIILYIIYALIIMSFYLIVHHEKEIEALSMIQLDENVTYNVVNNNESVDVSFDNNFLNIIGHENGVFEIELVDSNNNSTIYIFTVEDGIGNIEEKIK